MLAKRIIPCLDVKDGMVVKGVKFANHEIMGNILDYAKFYCDAGADEIVFYDITASADQRVVNKQWISSVARMLNIPFTVAGGIRTLEDARKILNAGADKISINSPALEKPELISQLANEFGSQCVVVGVDSMEVNGEYYVWQYTGDTRKSLCTSWKTVDWIKKVVELSAGEIVLNCMNQDGVRQGYDIRQLSMVRKMVGVPLIASGGAGSLSHFLQVFQEADVDGALAASVFHTKKISIGELKRYLRDKNIQVR